MVNKYVGFGKKKALILVQKKVKNQMLFQL